MGLSSVATDLSTACSWLPHSSANFVGETEAARTKSIAAVVPLFFC